MSAAFPGEWNDKYLAYYPRHYVRVLTGPEVVDAVAAVTGVPVPFKLSGEPVTRIKQLTTPGDIGRGGEALAVDSLMQSFFQSNRRTPPPTGNKPSTLQALLMMRSTVVNDRVQVAAGGRLRQWLAAELSDDALIDELFVSTLARTPEAPEREVAREALRHGRAAGLENLQWALLNSPEFLVNR